MCLKCLILFQGMIQKPTKYEKVGESCGGRITLDERYHSKAI